MWCYYTCRIAFYCSSHLAGSVSSADIVLKNLQYDVGPISFPTSSLSRFPTWSRCRPDVVSNVEPFRYRPDVGLISLTTSGRHQAHVQTWSRPDISRHLPISARYILPTSGCCRGRHLPISGRHRASMVFRNRPDIESISARCRPDIVDDIWLISARYILPTSGCCRGRHLPISGRHRASMVFRHRPDIESISATCRPDIVDDIWPTSSPRANMESARYQPTFADIGPI